MIDITKLTLKDVGKWVIYKDHDEEEKGRLKSWNDQYIFVVYKCDNQWYRFEQFTACATNPEYLSFEESHIKNIGIITEFEIKFIEIFLWIIFWATFFFIVWFVARNGIV